MPISPKAFRLIAMVSIDGKNYRAIISDVDGTLMGKDRTISQEVKNSIRKLKTSNVTFLVATGRNFYGLIKTACKELDLKAPQITAGGSEIVDPRTSEVISAEYIPNNEIKRLFDLLVSKNVAFWIEKDFCVYTKDAQEYPSLGPSVYKKLSNIKLNNVPKLGILPVEDVQIGEELEVRLKAEFKGLHVTKSFSPQGRTWDITGAMGNKQEAVLKVSRLLGILTQEIIGIGDGYNDFPLLEACGYKVAMDNANPELKEIADIVIPSLDEDGVAVFINGLLNK